jgi:asparagine synthase (glutamine-hydrolysing)
MCGIVGIGGHVRREHLAASIEAMNRAIVHRGPDDEGVWIGDDFAFGMRRLSIVDLAGGHQPMWDRRTGTGIVYNGEVYNYRVIRASLEKQGISFQTTSDTEVVLQSLALKGTQAVHEWNGMFALAAWNDRKKKLLLIRDRMGKKPLYYYWDGQILMFASEIKAILASNLFPKRVNYQAVWDYLTFRYVPGPQTIWQNIWKLPPAHMLEWSPNQQPHIFRYWKSDVASTDQPTNIYEKTKEFEELFLDSVHQRLLAADVPVGVMLSGGLDSSAVAAAAVELGHKPFHTFTVGFSEGGEYSEIEYARQVAKHLGVENHEVVVNRSTFLDMLPEAVRAADEPLADLTIVPFLAVSRLARESVKVVLSGEGADEILAGYNFESFQLKIGTIKRIQSVPPFLLKSFNRALSLVSQDLADKLSRAATTPLSSWNVANKNHMTRLWSESEKGAFWSGFNGQNSDSILESMYASSASDDPLDQMLSVFQQSWLVEDLLMKADKMSMAASLELRVPFLDYRLVEWANRQPLTVKVGMNGRRYVTKHVLRRFVRNRLPRQIITRPKRGFPIPVYSWFREDAFSRWALEHLTGREARVKHLLKPLELQRHLAIASSGDIVVGHKCWLLIVLETWLRVFDVETAVGASVSTPALVID